MWHDFCGRTHALKAKGRNLLPVPEGDVGVTQCFRGTRDGGDYSISLLNRRHAKYEDVKRQFVSSWRHPAARLPSVVGIFQIRNPPSLYERYLQEARRIDPRHRTEVRRWPRMLNTRGVSYFNHF